MITIIAIFGLGYSIGAFLWHSIEWIGLLTMTKPEQRAYIRLMAAGELPPIKLVRWTDAVGIVCLAWLLDVYGYLEILP